MQHAETFSWNMGNGSFKVKDFKVGNAMVWETVFLSTLYADTPRSADALMMYPIRHVWVSLDKFYPGNVYGMNVYIWADTGEVCYIHERVSTMDPPPELIANENDFAIEEYNNQAHVQFNPVALPALVAVTLLIVASWFLFSNGRNPLRRRSFKFGGLLLCLLSFTMVSCTHSSC